MTYADFITSWTNDICPNRNRNLRVGQALMNYLGEVWPEEYKRITLDYYKNKKEIDCFYDDNKIPALFNHLTERWPD